MAEAILATQQTIGFQLGPEDYQCRWRGHFLQLMSRGYQQMLRSNGVPMVVSLGWHKEGLDT
eukprot:4240707-Amphidinium_carterae.1